MLSVFFAVGVSDAVAYFHHVVADVLQPVAAEGAPDGYAWLAYQHTGAGECGGVSAASPA